MENTIASTPQTKEIAVRRPFHISRVAISFQKDFLSVAIFLMQIYVEMVSFNVRKALALNQS